MNMNNNEIISEGFFGNLFKPDPLIEKLGLKKSNGNYVTYNYPIKVAGKTFRPKIVFFGGYITNYHRKTFDFFENSMDKITPEFISKLGEFINKKVLNIEKNNDPMTVTSDFIMKNIDIALLGFFDSFEGFGFILNIENNNFLKNFGFSVIVDITYPNDINYSIETIYLK